MNYSERASLYFLPVPCSDPALELHICAPTPDSLRHLAQLANAGVFALAINGDVLRPSFEPAHLANPQHSATPAQADTYPMVKFTSHPPAKPPAKPRRLL